MSAARKTVTTDVQITRCDICGGEIEPEQVADDPMSIGTLGIVPPKPEPVESATEQLLVPHVGAPLSVFQRIKFAWPTQKRNKASREAAQTAHEEAKAAGFPNGYLSMYEGVEHVTWYDFHGECLANLVKAAVAMREKAEAKAQTEAHRAERAASRPATARKPATKKVAS